MPLNGREDIYEESNELKVSFGVLARSKKRNAGVRTERPVVVLTRTVDPVERLFVEKNHESVLAGNGIHQVHYNLVLVVGKVGLSVYRRQLKLIWRHLVVSGLERNAQLMSFYFQFTHECGHS